MTITEKRLAAVASSVKNSSFRAGLVTAVAASTARRSIFEAANALERGFITAFEFVSDFSETEMAAAERWVDFRASHGLAA